MYYVNERFFELLAYFKKKYLEYVTCFMEAYVCIEGSNNYQQL